MDRISASSAIRPVNYANAQPPSDRESESANGPSGTYVQAWHVPPFQCATRHDGSYQRLLAHLLGAMLWLDRAPPMTKDEKEWTINELQRYLKDVYGREEVPAETAQELANEIVRNCGQGGGSDEPSAAMVAFARDVVGEIREQSKIKVDVDYVLHGMARDTPRGFTAMTNEAVSDLLYQNHVMAWAKLGPGDEANGRAIVARQLLQTPSSDLCEELTASNLGLTSLPDLPKSLCYMNVGRNKLKELPVFPEEISVVLVYDNVLTKLPFVPRDMRYLHAENNLLTEIPYELRDTGDKCVFYCAGNPLSEEMVNYWKNLISNTPKYGPDFRKLYSLTNTFTDTVGKKPGVYTGSQISFGSEPPDLRPWDEWDF